MFAQGARAYPDRQATVEVTRDGLVDLLSTLF
jgi:hypothetical protein